MYDNEILDFLIENKIHFSILDEEQYEAYSDMKTFPFVGSRIDWKNLNNHCCCGFIHIPEFMRQVGSFISRNNFIKFILIGYDFEKGYLFNISIKDTAKILFFLAEYPGENYLIDVDEK